MLAYKVHLTHLLVDTLTNFWHWQLFSLVTLVASSDTFVDRSDPYINSLAGELDTGELSACWYIWHFILCACWHTCHFILSACWCIWHFILVLADIYDTYILGACRYIWHLYLSACRFTWHLYIRRLQVHLACGSQTAESVRCCSGVWSVLFNNLLIIYLFQI